jgi:hypothetical protein
MNQLSEGGKRALDERTEAQSKKDRWKECVYRCEGSIESEVDNTANIDLPVNEVKAAGSKE